MSWVKAVSYSGEDVFDEYADDINLLNREWMSNMKRRIRDGFVDGADAGEEASLQVGFNQGFREGAAQTAAVGRLKGIRVSQYEDTVMDVIKKALENPPPSVSSISESMEDLEVKQADSGCCGGECKETDCCSGREKMDLGVQKLPKMPCSGSDCSPSSRESLNHLLQRCVDLVSELGLPQELIGHIHELEKL